MKKIISIALSLVLILSIISLNFSNVLVHAEDFTMTGAELVSKIRVGWNLGNTMESNEPRGGAVWPNPVSVNTVETAWANPTTTQAIISKVYNAGFNAVRIPISWGVFVSETDGDYTIRQDWLDRIKEIVSYAYTHNMYVIINMHHDDGKWLSISGTDAEFDVVVEKYKQIWTRVATEFKDYNEKLIFEAANEITATTLFDGCGTSTGKCWWGHSSAVFTRMGRLYQEFYNAVRTSGGNNNKRYLMYPTYGAQWHSNQYNNVWLPENDTHTIVDIHWYTPLTSTDDRNYFTSLIGKYKSKFIDNGIGVVFGEAGLTKSNQSSLGTNYSERFVKAAAEKGIKTFLWDDGGNFQVLNRKTLAWVNPSYVAAILNAVPATTVPTTTKPNYGDVNNDQKINGSDVLLLRKYIVNNENVINKYAADVNNDTDINAKDVLQIRKFLADIIKTLG